MNFSDEKYKKLETKFKTNLFRLESVIITKSFFKRIEMGKNKTNLKGKINQSILCFKKNKVQSNFKKYIFKMSQHY